MINEADRLLSQSSDETATIPYDFQANSALGPHVDKLVKFWGMFEASPRLLLAIIWIVSKSELVATWDNVFLFQINDLG